MASLPETTLEPTVVIVWQRPENCREVLVNPSKDFHCLIRAR
jgi:hypothetical protein